MNDELMEFAEEMQVFLHKGNKLVSKLQKHMGIPLKNFGQRNRPHDLPPAYPQFKGDYDMYMGEIWENQLGMGQRNNMGSGMGQRGGGMDFGQRGGGYNQRMGNDFDPNY